MNAGFTSAFEAIGSTLPDGQGGDVNGRHHGTIHFVGDPHVTLANISVVNV